VKSRVDQTTHQHRGEHCQHQIEDVYNLVRGAKWKWTAEKGRSEFTDLFLKKFHCLSIELLISQLRPRKSVGAVERERGGEENGVRSEHESEKHTAKTVG
jgi:hypothetical protein